MRRTTIALFVGLLVAVAGFGGVASSQESGADPVGSWRMMGLGAPGTPDEDPILATFAADGTAIVSSRAVRPALPGLPFSYTYFSTGNGVWEATDDGQVSFTVMHIRTDETGTYRGMTTFSGILTISADGQSVSGEATYTIYDPGGTQTGVIPTPLQGTRIVVEPLATPAA